MGEATRSVGGRSRDVPRPLPGIRLGGGRTSLSPLAHQSVVSSGPSRPMLREVAHIPMGPLSRQANRGTS